MRITSIACAALLISFLFCIGCSTLRSGTAVTAAQNEWERPATAESRFEDPDEGWAARNLPGYKSLRRLLPPPSDARRKWDEAEKTRRSPWGDSTL